MFLKIRKFGIFYLTGGLAALWLKYRYGRAGSEELLWILAPVAGWVKLLGGLPFCYEPGVGYVNHTIRFIIAPSCSGVQFLIIVMLLLLFTFVHRMGTRKRGAVWMVFSMAMAYGYTVFVNGIRIVLAIYIPGWMEQRGIAWEYLTPKRLHTVIGGAVYFAALLILCRVTDAVLYRLEDPFAEERESSIQPGFLSGIRQYLAPAFWYLFLVLGVPLLNRALAKDGEGYIEYALMTGGVCLGILAVTGIVSRIQMCYTILTKRQKL